MEKAAKSGILSAVSLAMNLQDKGRSLAMSLWPFKDRRAVPRWRVAMNIIYGVGDDMTATTTVDISEDSVSVFVREPFPIGKVVDVHLAVDANERWIKVKGKVT